MTDYINRELAKRRAIQAQEGARNAVIEAECALEYSRALQEREELVGFAQKLAGSLLDAGIQPRVTLHEHNQEAVVGPRRLRNLGRRAISYPPIPVTSGWSLERYKPNLDWGWNPVKVSVGGKPPVKQIYRHGALLSQDGTVFDVDYWRNDDEPQHQDPLHGINAEEHFIIFGRRALELLPPIEEQYAIDQRVIREISGTNKRILTGLLILADHFPTTS